MKEQQQKKRKQQRWGLTLSLVIFVFAVMLAAILAAGGIVLILLRTGLLHLDAKPGPPPHGALPLFSLIPLSAFCVILGVALTWFFGKRALDPLRQVIEATRKIASGDFSVRVRLKGVGELQELSHSFNKMAQELASIETLRSDFINNYSHEFKSPIVSLRGYAKLLKEGACSEAERREYLDIIIEESERLVALSTNVLALSKYETTEIITDAAPFRLDEQIRRVIVLAEPKWAAKEIAVNVELDEILFEGSEDLMQEIWANLLDNAIKFLQPGGTISIGLRRESEGVRFIIEDNGPGMDAQTQAHIFDKFYQGDTSHAKEGIGLGLAIVQRIAAMCGGSVAVQSRLGEGSRFTVWL